MTVSEALRNRRSCRSFATTPLAAGTLDDLVDRARRTPTAGNCQGVEFLALEGTDVSAYWDTTLPPDRRGAFPWPGLVDAPALVLAFGLPSRYLDRYAEPDKEGAGLSQSTTDWPVPYWLTDAAFAAMALQLLAVEAGLGCCFFGLFEHEEAVRERFEVPDDVRAIGTVALGHPALPDGRASVSTTRARRPLEEVLHRGTWRDGG